MMSLVMSGGGAERSGLKRGVGASRGGDVDIGGDGVVVGAEGAYPVEIGFTSGRGGGRTGHGAGGGEAETEEGASAEEVARDEKIRGARKKGPEDKVDDKANALSSSLGVGQDEKTRRGGVDEASGLGSWAADFGLFVSDDGKDLEGTGGFEANPLAGWGAYEAGVSMEAKEESGVIEGVGGERRGAGFEQPVAGVDETGVPRAEAAKAATKDNRQVAAKDPVAGELRSATEATGVDGDTDLGAAGVVAPRAPENSERDRSGFIAGLGDISGDRGDEEVANLEAAARVAGGELYALDDRLSALSVLLGQRPRAGNGKGAASVSAAAGEVAWLRSILKTGEYSDHFRRPGEVRQATKAIERGVRSAERAVERDIALLDDAGGPLKVVAH